MNSYKKWIVPAVIVILIIVLFVNGRSTYNSMVTLSEDVDQAWAKVEVQYQRRMDLIPYLVETVKGYAAHESSTYENVTRARAGLDDAYNAAKAVADADATASENDFDNYTSRQADLGRALSIYVNAVREAYPDLKADTQFTDLQTQLESTENRIATERGRYTDTVRSYNVAVRRFPANLWAGIFGFATKPQYKADPQAAQAPQVRF